MGNGQANPAAPAPPPPPLAVNEQTVVDAYNKLWRRQQEEWKDVSRQRFRYHGIGRQSRVLTHFDLGPIQSYRVARVIKVETVHDRLSPGAAAILTRTVQIADPRSWLELYRLVGGVVDQLATDELYLRGLFRKQGRAGKPVLPVHMRKILAASDRLATAYAQLTDLERVAREAGEPVAPPAFLYTLPNGETVWGSGSGMRFGD